MKTIEQLRDELKKALGALDTFEKSIVDAEGKDRDMTEEEFNKHTDLLNAIESLSKQIDAREKSTKVRANLALPADGEAGRVPAQAKGEELPFKSFGEQLQKIAEAGMNKGAQHDSRLVWQKAAGANEAVPSEGGFLVQTDFNTALLGRMNQMGSVLSRVRRIPLSATSNGIKLPAVDETSRVNGSRWGGVNAYWLNEADTATASKPKFREIDLKLNKLMAIGYATEEILEDAAALEAVMMQAFSEELTFKTEDSFINGTGSGQPLGILNSPALVSVAADSGQAAATITTTNVLNMWDRLPTRSKAGSVWLIADSLVETQLHQLVLGSGTAVQQLYRMPDANAAVPANQVFGSLIGRPVIPVEYMAQLGTVGDIALVDLSQYLMIDKGGMETAQSMHVRFLYDEMTFRLTYRIDGQPAWHSAITPANASSATKSPYIALATRS